MKTIASSCSTEMSSQDRLLILIGTLLQFPGVGCPTAVDSTEHHDALQAVVRQMQVFATSIRMPIPAYSTHTIRKDLQRLRQYGILEDRMYRWGYYLGTGALSRAELSMALQALASQAAMQGDPRIQAVYDSLAQRLRTLNLELGGQLFYPVRTQMDRSIVQTDPEVMRAKGQYKSTLFAKLPELETAIIKGQGIELFRAKSPYRQGRVGTEQVYPLQLIYADIAWYLLTENVSDGHLAISRVDRFTAYLQPLDFKARGMEAQQTSLDAAHELLRNGWGLSLGNLEEQRLERIGKLMMTEMVVRFSGSVIPFILEGELRHPKQKVKQRKNKLGELVAVDYKVPLPQRSWFEFARWVRGFGADAQVIAPEVMVQQFRKMVEEMARLYAL
jgi:hypothetical protein